MKVAVLADIHGNLPSFQAVLAHVDAWQPDKVLLGGDVVNRGPRPTECLQILLEKAHSDGWRSVRGNHEDYVLARCDDVKQPDESKDPRLSIYRNSFWTYEQLNGELGTLKEMPFQISLDGPDQREIRVVHASMIHNRDGIYPGTSDRDLRMKIQPAPAVLCVGHTHRPLIREIDQTLVVNVGSVGMPFDGDSRACYAQLTWRKGKWKAEIIRLSYDLAAAEQDYFDSGFIPEAGPLVKLMLVEFRRAQPHLHLWTRRYEQAVLAGKMSIDDSVSEYISGLPSRKG